MEFGNSEIPTFQGLGWRQLSHSEHLRSQAQQHAAFLFSSTASAVTDVTLLRRAAHTISGDSTMAVATATAHSGQVRFQRRAWTMSRGCWRLVVLLGLAWVALVLLGGTAQAAPTEKPGDSAAPAAPRPVPLLGQTLANVGTLVDELPLDHVTQRLTGSRTAVPQPLAEAVETATKTVATAADTAAKTASAVATAAPAYLPAVDGLEVATGLADSVRATAEATAAEQELLDVAIPSIAATLSPVAAAAADQVDTTTQTVAATVEILSAPLPVAQPLNAAVAPLVGAIDGATDAFVAATSLTATMVDGVVGATTRALDPFLAVVTAPAGSVGVTATSGAGAGIGPVAQPDLNTINPGTDATGSDLPAPAALRADSALPDSTHGRPAVPPPDAATVSTYVVAQSASDIATALAVPVSGAGSTTGHGGSFPTPALDQTLVRVEAEPEFVTDSTDPIEGPTGPMPGTPCADPSFSPD